MGYPSGILIIFIEDNFVNGYYRYAFTERMGSRFIADIHVTEYRKCCYSFLFHGKEESKLTFLGKLLILTGSILILIGSTSLFYKKDFMEKLHVLSISDTIGIFLFLIGVFFLSNYPPKMALLLVVFLITAPMNTHVMARAFFLRSKKK